MFDFGEPILTDFDDLKEIILPPTLLNSLTDTLTKTGMATDNIPKENSFSPAYKHRTSNLLIKSNDIDLNVTEFVTATFNKNNTVVKAEINGRIDVSTNLSESSTFQNTTLQMSFVNPLLLTPKHTGCLMSLNDGVSRDKWMKESILSYQTQKSTETNICLANYNIIGSDDGVRNSMLLKNMPISINRSCGFTGDKGTLDPSVANLYSL